jgi:DNA modification methylase
MPGKAALKTDRQPMRAKNDVDPIPCVPTLAYESDLGSMYHGRVEEALRQKKIDAMRGKVDLIFTSPPFPLVTKKKYGNETGDAYLKWLEGMAVMLSEMVSPTGSIVLELGNAWEKNSPTMSTLPLEALLAFKRAAKLHLCQHIICHNPARLPGPAAWVTVDKIRLKDTYTHVWWMSKVERPKADNSKVLVPYSKEMQALLKRQSYNAGKRPSGHHVSPAGFLTDRGGAISANVLDFPREADRIPPSLLKFAGTGWDTAYRAYCEAKKVEAHPARMQMDLAVFFIYFLTDEGDLVMDPFAGSNTTGSAAETLKRRWISIEAENRYVIGSKGRFTAFFKDAGALASRRD